MKSRIRLGFSDLLGETRLLGEFASFTVRGLLHRAVPHARRHKSGVLLIPGFLSGDGSLSPLARSLRELGYRIFFSGIWYNVDCPAHMMPRLEKVLRNANYVTHAKVFVIGHSLGGLYARELACRFPNLVKRAILLGSPVKEPLESPNKFLRPLFRFWHRRCAGSLSVSSRIEEAEMSSAPPRVPETLVYSKSDGVVGWRNCIETGTHIEAVEVPSSHCGLPFSPEVFEIISNRLGRLR